MTQPSSAQPRDCLDRAVDRLLALQHPDGWWKGELETNVTMEAEDLLLRHVLGILDEPVVAATARWIRSKQRDDGTWATFSGGPGDLSTTVEAYVALRLAGDPSDAPHLTRAREFVRAEGGLERTRVFTRIWLALVGAWPWDQLPALPPELIWLPRWFPLNVYDWACWARQTVVPLTVVSALRPVHPPPFSLDELRSGAAPPALASRGTARMFQRLDRLVWRYHRRAPGRLRRAAMRRCVQWVIERQEADGGWGGIQPPWVYSVLALFLSGYALDHRVLAAALDGLEGFTIREETPDGPVLRLEACQSPVWDTALASIALRESERVDAEPALKAAADWLVREEIRVRGDWAVRRPALEPGGWAFEFANDLYPDIDDTAEVVLALRDVPEAADAVRRGVAWTVGMQSGDGGWGAFDADNTRALCTQLPFCDFGAVIDPPSADVTAHVVEMLAQVGPVGEHMERAFERGVAWLRASQEADGSWFGRWGANHVYGTGAVMPALVGAGLPPDDPVIRRGVAWLVRHQNPDGGWGEDLRSYRNATWRGRGASTASQTAWALLGLIAAGETGEQARRGVDWLVRTQQTDGSWPEDLYTGTGFPGDFYINYHLYRLVFPVTALARYVRAVA